MEIQVWIELIIEVLTGLAVAIPLVIKLVQMVQIATKEKNWNIIVDMVLKYMVQAEKDFTSGAERKEWVMNAVKEAAIISNYDYDEVAEAKVSDMIDAICRAARKIN